MSAPLPEAGGACKSRKASDGHPSSARRPSSTATPAPPAHPPLWVSVNVHPEHSC